MPGKRSDPKKLAADREAIRESVESFDRRQHVYKSAAKAVEDYKAFKATGEGTLGEAFKNVVVEPIQGKVARRRARRAGYGPAPQVEGAAQVGFRKPRSDA